MEILEYLITDKTDILLLSNKNISNEQKQEILGFSSCLCNHYKNYIYENNGNIYYFKDKCKILEFPFSLVDELIGSYLCHYLDLETVKYSIATNKYRYGLASPNFRNRSNDYYFLNDFTHDEGINNYKYKLNILKNLCIDEKNYQELLKNIINLIVLDIYMIQRDRCNINLQFKVNKKTKYLSFAPIYDFSNCSDKIKTNMEITNPFLRINENNIIKFLKDSKYFKERLSYILEYDMAKIWEQICIDYNLNQECFIYDKIKEYYKNKDTNQKKYLKQLIKDVHM